MKPSRKPVLFWAMWPDELSAQFERSFEVIYLQDHPNTFAVGPNHRLDQRFEEIGRITRNAPCVFFLNSWTKCDSLLGLDLVPMEKVAYLHDSHFDLESFDWDLAQAFSHVFLENRISVDYHVRRGSRNGVTWCPLYFKGTRAEARRLLPSAPRPIDVAFVGNTNEQIHPGRVAFLRTLEERLGGVNPHGGSIRRPRSEADGGGQVRCFFGPGDVRETYPRARIVINESWQAASGNPATAYGVNFRVFEAMGCGAMLLTDSPPSFMPVLFQDGLHFVSYRHGDVDDAASRIAHYLAHDDERLRIAAAGWEETLQSHTVDARAESLAPMLENLAENGVTPQAAPDSHVSFHLGRALLRSLLVWRQQGPCERNFYYVERLAEADRLIRNAIQSPEWSGPARALLPLIRFASGDRQGAIAEWMNLLNSPSSAPYSGLLLGALLDRVDAQGRDSTLKHLSELASSRLPREEGKVFAEIACRAFYAEAA